MNILLALGSLTLTCAYNISINASYVHAHKSVIKMIECNWLIVNGQEVLARIQTAQQFQHILIVHSHPYVHGLIIRANHSPNAQTIKEVLTLHAISKDLDVILQIFKTKHLHVQTIQQLLQQLHIAPLS